VRRPATGARDGGREVSTAIGSVEDDGATHLPGEEVRATAAWCAQTRAVGSGAATASYTSCRGGA
jgi:hypothetical protein